MKLTLRRRTARGASVNKAGQLKRPPAAVIVGKARHRQGASKAQAHLSRHNGRRRVQIWFAQHLRAMTGSLGQYARAPAGQFLTTAVIAVTLTLPAGFFLFLENARQLTGHWEQSAQISVFLREDIDLPAAQQLRNALRNDAGIATVQLIDKEQSLAEYRDWSGFADVIDSLSYNPLPHVLIVQPARDDAIAALAQRLATRSEVNNVQHDQQWMERLLSMLDILRRLAILLSCVLAVAVLLIVGNFIRLSVYDHKPEIEVAKLFGATDAFIQRPFLYSGFWHGVFAALLSWLFLSLALFSLREPLHRLVQAYDSTFSLITLDMQHFLILLGIAISLGLLGSWLSVRRHIKAIEPA